VGNVKSELASLSPGDEARVRRAFGALKQRGVEPFFVPDRRAALSCVLGLLPLGANVAHGHSTTLEQIGLVDHLRQPESGYRYLNDEWQAEDDPRERHRLRARLSLEADYFLGSVQAVCESGEAVGADATGSRQAFYIYGPPTLIWVAGINKLVPTLEDGLRRTRQVALALEDQRMKRLGRSGSVIGKLVIYERQSPGRTTLILVGEPLGY
jgi:hypothetical protein